MDDLVPVTPMNDMPKGKLFYLDLQVLKTSATYIEDITIFTLEEQIYHYDQKYENNKNSLFSIERAYDGLLKSIYYRTKKIMRDHCE